MKAFIRKQWPLIWIGAVVLAIMAVDFLMDGATKRLWVAFTG